MHRGRKGVKREPSESIKFVGLSYLGLSAVYQHFEIKSDPVRDQVILSPVHIAESQELEILHVGRIFLLYLLLHRLLYILAKLNRAAADIVAADLVARIRTSLCQENVARPVVAEIDNCNPDTLNAFIHILLLLYIRPEEDKTDSNPKGNQKPILSLERLDSSDTKEQDKHSEISSKFFHSRSISRYKSTFIAWSRTARHEHCVT
jgi:hypothetical protein